MIEWVKLRKCASNENMDEDQQNYNCWSQIDIYATTKILDKVYLGVANLN